MGYTPNEFKGLKEACWTPWNGREAIREVIRGTGDLTFATVMRASAKCFAGVRWAA